MLKPSKIILILLLFIPIADSSNQTDRSNCPTRIPRTKKCFQSRARARACHFRFAIAKWRALFNYYWYPQTAVGINLTTAYAPCLELNSCLMVASGDHAWWPKARCELESDLYTFDIDECMERLYHAGPFKSCREKLAVAWRKSGGLPELSVNICTRNYALGWKEDPSDCDAYLEKENCMRGDVQRWCTANDWENFREHFWIRWNVKRCCGPFPDWEKPAATIPPWTTTSTTTTTEAPGKKRKVWTNYTYPPADEHWLDPPTEAPTNETITTEQPEDLLSDNSTFTELLVSSNVTDSAIDLKPPKSTEARSEGEHDPPTGALTNETIAIQPSAEGFSPDNSTSAQVLLTSDSVTDTSTAPKSTDEVEVEKILSIADSP